MSRPYYTLVSLPTKASPALWAIEFGDFDRAVVRDEMRDRMEEDRLTCKRGARPVYRIVTHKPREQRLMVAALNRVEARA